MKELYQASYEQVKGFVSEKYVTASIKTSTRGQILKRFIGLLVTWLFIIAVAYGSVALEKGSPYDIVVIPGKLIPIWWLAILIIGVRYISGLFRYKNHKVESGYEFHKAISSSTLVFTVQVFLFLCSVANMMVNSFIVTVIYVLLVASFIYFQLINGNREMYKKIFVENNSKENKALVLGEKLQKFSLKYGGPIILLGVIYKHFTDGNKASGNGFYEQVVGTLSPLITFIMLWIIIVMREEGLKGFYLKKYSEEFRIQYGYTKKEWYGPKSKAYLTDPTEQAVAQQRTNQAHGDGQVRFKKIDK